MLKASLLIILSILDFLACLWENTILFLYHRWGICTLGSTLGSLHLMPDKCPGGEGGKAHAWNWLSHNEQYFHSRVSNLFAYWLAKGNNVALLSSIGLKLDKKDVVVSYGVWIVWCMRTKEHWGKTTNDMEEISNTGIYRADSTIHKSPTCTAIVIRYTIRPHAPLPPPVLKTL